MKNSTLENLMENTRIRNKLCDLRINKIEDDGDTSQETSPESIIDESGICDLIYLAQEFIKEAYEAGARAHVEATKLEREADVNTSPNDDIIKE